MSLPLLLTVVLSQALPSSPDAGAAPVAAPAPALRMRFVGDVMLGSSFPEGYLAPEDGAQLLSAVRPLLVDADFTFANLEGPLCDGGQTRKCRPGKPSGTCYAFRSPTRYGKYLVEAGIDVVSTANNHSGDFGEPCRRETEQTLDALGIKWSGPPGSIATLDHQGRKVALVAFHTSAGCNHLNDLPAAKKLVRAAKEQHWLVVVSFHGGAEGSNATRVKEGREFFHKEDRGDLRSFARGVIDAGADLVVGHGPHVLRGMETYQGKLIAYSLGNFATYGRFSLAGKLSLGAVLEVELAADGRFEQGRVFPTVQEGEGVPRPDPQGKGLEELRSLTLADFPKTGVTIGDDGRITAP